MIRELLARLRCPACAVSPLELTIIDADGANVRTGIVWCRACAGWFPMEDGLLDLLVSPVAYVEDRRKFWRAHERHLRSLGLAPPGHAGAGADARLRQQRHFDWYASNASQTYDQFARSPFWQAVDELVFDRWRPLVGPRSWVLDVGCAQGRSAARFKDADLQIVGFDVAKHLVRQAIERARRERWTCRSVFLAADATAFPFVDRCFDCVVLYGVLHHLPDPVVACTEIARVLKPGGLFLGSENNRSVFRLVFDALQRLWPLWYEEAGSFPVVSRDDLERWLGARGVSLNIGTTVFVPPHLLNLVGPKVARRMLSFTDRMMGSVPFLRDQGGLVVVTGLRS